MSDPFSIEQVEQALRNAHMAGDSASAERIAQRLQEMRSAKTQEQRRQVSSGATLKFGPWDTGVGIPQWLDEGLAGAGRRAMQIATLGNNPMKDETSDRLLNDSTAATVGSVLTDVGTMAGGGAALRAAGTIPQIASKAPALGRAMQATGQAMFAPKSIPSAAVAGGAYSGLTTDGSLDDRILATAIGTGAGAAGQAAPRLFASQMHAEVNPAVADLARRGVRMTPGQIAGGKMNVLEQKATSLPFIGPKITAARAQSLDDFATAAYNEALKPVNRMVTGTGRAAAKSAYDQMDEVYGKIVPKLRIGSDIDITQRWQAIAANLDDDAASRFMKFMNTRVGSKFDPDNGLTGEAFKKVESELKAEARRWGKSAIVAEQDYGAALRAARDEMIEVSKKYSPASAIRQLAKADLAYARLERVAGAAEMLGAKQGHFTPSQLINQVKSKEGSRLAFRKGEAMMQDLAEMADPVLSTRFPNSGTADRSAVVGGVLGGGGALGGLWLDPITTLAAGGALYGGSQAFNEGGRALAQQAMTRQSLNPLMQEAARLTRRVAPYVGGAGIMLSPSVYAEEE